MWMLLVLAYGLLKGARDLIKKKSLEKSTVLEVLFMYTLLSFLMVTPEIPKAGGMTLPQYGWVALKSFIIFIAWICSFYAIERLPISYCGILDLSRVLFATMLGVVILGESLGVLQIIGLVLVCFGLLFLRERKGLAEDKKEHVQAKYVILALISCVLNAVSGLMDKILMKDMNSNQLQFWYMLFLVIYYAIYILVTKTKLRWKQMLKNYWIWILALLFVVADKALFLANGMEASRVTVMTLIKQSGCIVTILGGKFIFKEKNIGHKLICAGIIIAGIVVAVM